MFFRKLILKILTPINLLYASSDEVISCINKVDFDRAVLDICVANIDYCRVLTDKTIYNYLHKYYKSGLITIAHIESNFRYRQGKIDKNDISFFQINKKIWNREKLIKYNMDYPYYQIKNDVCTATEVALKVWLVNIAQYISKKKKYPKSLTEYISLYHRIDKISKHYKKRANKVVWNYITLKERM